MSIYRIASEARLRLLEHNVDLSNYSYKMTEETFAKLVDELGPWVTVPMSSNGQPKMRLFDILVEIVDAAVELSPEEEQPSAKAVHKPDYSYEADMVRRLKELLSVEAEQVTGKLNKCDDSLLKADTETCKEQKSKLDLISRQDAIEELERIMCDHPLRGYEDEQLLINAVESLPSADRPTGEWQDEHGKPMRWGSFAGYCSNCGKWSEYLTDYCGNCGAKMGDDVNEL